ncbi:NAD(P)-dependent iron-only hydrogenase catalytic subunit [Clostridium collagenovorans DSM 3089]|uniref:NAD(P)-dependent iron-only hydrogenase catalytic subunit n=1 Tax=Clostridium collagenovorans DSM 3089 TaxID=1121306 RepID=A0A1M5U640_9CLOT|nr:NADH-dependent [FeFe] hydrogenase, group A6 [Clostridium collagenovorans]SHH58183.1 NAD(P)-dependent iron-only hydrogenase catalytic subunit [Clostridium collagenovorans DSM 3089]
MSMINLKVNNNEVEVEKGSTVLDAIKTLGIKIPTLCHMYMGNNGDIRNCKGTCRVCMVEDEKWGELIPSCSIEAKEGMSIKTHSQKAIKARKTVVELLLSDHPQDCLTCDRNNNCELQKLAAEMGIERVRFNGAMSTYPVDESSPSIFRDMDKCILCRRCVTACNDMQKVNALTPVDRGFDTVMSTFFKKPLNETDCTHCGQCVAVCPTAALTEVKDYHKIWSLLEDKSKYVVVQTAPAVRVALGEEFGLERGEVATKKMVGALKALGFDAVYDTNFGADLTIMEEATEFIDRFTKGENLPIITSCCPAWVSFVEKKYPEHLNLISSCKSPQQMFGAMAKTYLSKKIGVDSKDIVVVSIMPCTAKKYEAKREEMGRDGIQDVDIVITTREFAKMIKEAGFNLNSMKEEDFDNPLGESTGAGSIFGVTGGVMEAALRTSYEWVTGETLDSVDFHEVRGIDGIKEATVNLKGKEVNIAVVSSLGNAKIVMDNIKEGKCNYDFIEVMACPGGCINGGGQPSIKADLEAIANRTKGIYSVDAKKTIRKAHENPMIKQLYKEYLEEPSSHLAHELLHVNYKK